MAWNYELRQEIKMAGNRDMIAGLRYNRYNDTMTFGWGGVGDDNEKWELIDSFGCRRMFGINEG